MLSRFKILSESKFVRSVAVLAGGSAFAQAIALLVLPILTRLYSPDDFGVLAVYVGIITVMSSAACLRFEIAIPIADDDGEAFRLLVLSLFSTLIMSFIALAAVVLAPAWISEKIGLPNAESHLWLIPIGVFLAASYNAFLFLATRQKLFSLVARTRLTQTIGSAGVQLSLGLFGYAPLGLILGYAVNVGAGSVGLCRRLIGSSFSEFFGFSRNDLKKTFFKYSQYPKLSTLEALANNAAIQGPVVVIAAMQLGKEAGFLLLAMRVMQAPIGLVGQAISQVFFSRAPEEYRSGRLHVFSEDVLAGLIKTGVGPLCFIGLVSPVLFEIVFGQEWRRAGDLVLMMTPWFVFQFLASPLSMSLHVTGRQGLALGLQMSGLFLRVGSVLATGIFSRHFVSEAYAASGAVFYLIYLLVIAWAIGLPLASLFTAVRRGVKIVVVWLLLGFVSAFFLSALMRYL